MGIYQWSSIGYWYKLHIFVLVSSQWPTYLFHYSQVSLPYQTKKSQHITADSSWKLKITSSSSRALSYWFMQISLIVDHTCIQLQEILSNNDISPPATCILNTCNLQWQLRTLLPLLFTTNRLIFTIIYTSDLKSKTNFTQHISL